MGRHTDLLGSISPSVRGVKRASDILAALAPPPKHDVSGADSTALTPPAQGGIVVKPTKEESPSLFHEVMGFAPGLAAGAVGSYAWDKHRVLGFLAGHALGSSVMPIWNGGDERKDALLRLGVEGAGIGGALLYDKHPFFGWLGGVLLGATVTAFIPKSPVQQAWAKLSADSKKKAA